MTHEEQIKWMTDRIAHLETQHESAMEMVATLMGKLNAVVTAERKACAELCIELAPSTKTMTAYKVLHEASKAILARGQS
jgi:homoserine dehydrogenase